MAVDSTGLGTHHVSRYYHWRGEQAGRRGGGGGWGQTPARRRWPKLTLSADVASHLVLGWLSGWGPTHDAPAFLPLLARTRAGLPAGVTLARVLADAGFDAERHHRVAHERLGIPSVVIALNRGRHAARPPRGPYRRALAARFPRARYRQRAQIESLISRLKRRLGSALTARRPRTQREELALRALTHNILLLHHTQSHLSTEPVPPW